MGACDFGGCCRGNVCLPEPYNKKCCCEAAKGSFRLGEVCRMVACNFPDQCYEVELCECVNNGGTLTQSCDPCANKTCNKCEVCRDGKCVSTCSACQACDTSSINGTCVDKCTGGGSVSPVTCGQCQTCSCGNCVPTGVACGSACCSFSQCCVGGVCVSCDCTGQISPGPCYECRSGVYVNKCSTSQHCCNGVCSECSQTSHCPTGKVCINCECVPISCCVAVPACAPHSVYVTSQNNPCETLTYDYMGEPCVETRYPLDCASASCTYTWSGSQWDFEACSVTTTQGLLLFTNETCCTSSGCPATLSAPAGTIPGERAFGVSCENPLP